MIEVIETVAVTYLFFAAARFPVVIYGAGSSNGIERCVPIFHVRAWSFSRTSLLIIACGTGLLCVVA